MASKTSQSYFYLARKDRRGAIFLFAIILLICMVPFLYVFFFNVQITEETQFDASLATLRTKQAQTRQQKVYKTKETDYRPYDHPSSSSYTRYASKTKGALFIFDPNSISAEGWKKLGLRDKTIATILNFRSKGGRFRQPEDIKKIWGLFPDEAERLLPFIQIAPGEQAKQTYIPSAPPYSKGPAGIYARAKIVDANIADSSALIALPGIGSKLSQRIINFRDRLGGFYSVEQVKETFGLPDSVYQKIKPMLQVSGVVKQLNVNSASADELKLHPYIKYHLANALVEYRKQHGNYQSLEEIKKIMILTDEIYQKLHPYLKTE